MRTNFDQRVLRTNADAGAPYQAFNAEYDSVRFDNDSQAYVNANNDPYPFITNIIDSNNRPTLGVGNYPANSYSYAPNADNWQDYYSNREHYDSLLAGQKQNLTSVYGFKEADANTIQKILSAYDPFVDYRTDFSNQNPLVGDFSTDTRTNSGTAQEKAALNYISEARGARQTARRKGFQSATLSAIISFITAGSTLGAGEAAGAASAAGSEAAGAATTGGFFAGSGGILGGTGNALADAALNSAIQGGLSSAFQGGDPLTGALTGGATGGLGGALSGVDFGLGGAGNSALSGLIRGGVSSGISGGNPLIGALTGGITSGAGSLFKGSGGDILSGDNGASQNGLADLFNGSNSSTTSPDFLGSITNSSGVGGATGVAGGNFYDFLGDPSFDSSGFSDLISSASSSSPKLSSDLSEDDLLSQSSGGTRNSIIPSSSKPRITNAPIASRPNPNLAGILSQAVNLRRRF